MDVTPRDNINMSDAMDHHRRAICAAFGVPVGYVARHPLAAFYEDLRRVEAAMNEELLASFALFAKSIEASVIHVAEDSSSSGVSSTPQPHAGAAAASFRSHGLPGSAGMNRSDVDKRERR